MSRTRHSPVTEPQRPTTSLGIWLQQESHDEELLPARKSRAVAGTPMQTQRTVAGRHVPRDREWSPSLSPTGRPAVLRLLGVGHGTQSMQRQTFREPSKVRCALKLTERQPRGRHPIAWEIRCTTSASRRGPEGDLRFRASPGHVF